MYVHGMTMVLHQELFDHDLRLLSNTLSSRPTTLPNLGRNCSLIFYSELPICRGYCRGCTPLFGKLKELLDDYGMISCYFWMSQWISVFSSSSHVQHVIIFWWRIDCRKSKIFWDINENDIWWADNADIMRSGSLIPLYFNTYVGYAVCNRLTNF